MEFIKKYWKSLAFLAMAAFIFVLLIQYYNAEEKQMVLVAASKQLESERDAAKKTTEVIKKEIAKKEKIQTDLENTAVEQYGKIVKYREILDKLRGQVDYSAEKNDTLEKCRANLEASKDESEALICQLENYKLAQEDQEQLIFNLKDQIVSRDLLIEEKGKEIISLTQQLNFTATVAKMKRRPGLISIIKYRFAVVVGPTAGIGSNGQFWAGAGITVGLKIN